MTSHNFNSDITLRFSPFILEVFEIFKKDFYKIITDFNIGQNFIYSLNYLFRPWSFIAPPAESKTKHGTLHLSFMN